MDNTFLAAPRRARKRALVAVAAVALVLSAAVVVTRGGDQGTAHAAPADTAVPVEAATAAASPAQSPGGAATASPLTLVDGARRVNGVAVGYPHSRTGAVSAAMEYATQMGSTLDPARAVQIGEAITDPATGRPAAAFAEGPTDSRRRLGLAMSGPVPTGASMSLGPVSYQIRDADRDHVNVLLLGYLTVITPAKGMQNLVGVFPMPLVWSDGDWKMVRRAADAPDYAELRLAPGSTEAVAAGWLPLTA